MTSFSYILYLISSTQTVLAYRNTFNLGFLCLFDIYYCYLPQVHPLAFYISHVSATQIKGQKYCFITAIFLLIHSFPCFSFFFPVFYSNTEQSRVFLTRSSPLSLCQSIQYSSRTIYLCWHYLTDAVRSVNRGAVAFI